MDKAREATHSESARFQRALETISEFFAMDNPGSSFNRVLRDLMECCPEGVIVGGMAVSFLVKNPRTTKDVDIILLDLSPQSVQFRQRFDRVDGKPLTVRHKETGIEVDLLTTENPGLNAGLLRAAQAEYRMFERAGTQVRVASPEMIVALKMRRAMTNTPEGFQDRSDILSILRDNPEIEIEAVRVHLSGDEIDMYDDLLTYRDKMLTGELHD